MFLIKYDIYTTEVIDATFDTNDIQLLLYKREVDNDMFPLIATPGVI